ncbi:hypothetical protein evm_014169 [Chilo suppressalis]|nr:hypothetical protein evm_014169 [Chilo suppressalis]
MYTIDEFSEANCTNFLLFLKDKWDEIHNKTNIFRYKIDNTSEKVIDGYLLQLNPDRCSKRRTPEKIESVCQPFNKNKFNFTKVSPEEIITSLRDKSRKY